MQFVCAGLYRDVYDRARLPAILRGRVFDDVEFLNGVDWENGRRITGDAGAVNNALAGKRFAVIKAVY